MQPIVNFHRYVLDLDWKPIDPLLVGLEKKWGSGTRKKMQDIKCSFSMLVKLTNALLCPVPLMPVSLLQNCPSFFTNGCICNCISLRIIVYSNFNSVF